MNKYQASASAIIDAPAASIYELLADYRQGHPSILPPRSFTAVEVTKGGQGAGTQVLVKMDIYGTQLAYQMTVSEPEPGRILQEEDDAAGVVTSFTVEPVSAAQARVTIATVTSVRPGLKGWLESLTAPRVMRRIYREELALIAAAVQQQ